MKELTKFQMYLYNIGGILLLIGAFMPVEVSLMPYAPYVYLSGAVAFGGMQLLQRYEGQNITIKRLRRQQVIASCLIIASGFVFMLTAHGLLPLQEKSWMVLLAIGAFLELYVSFRLPAEIRKEN